MQILYKWFTGRLLWKFCDDCYNFPVLTNKDGYKVTKLNVFRLTARVSTCDASGYPTIKCPALGLVIRSATSHQHSNELIRTLLSLDARPLQSLPPPQNSTLSPRGRPCKFEYIGGSGLISPDIPPPELSPPFLHVGRCQFKKKLSASWAG